MPNSAECMTLNFIFIPSVDCAITQVMYYNRAQIKNCKLLLVCFPQEPASLHQVWVIKSLWVQGSQSMPLICNLLVIFIWLHQFRYNLFAFCSNGWIHFVEFTWLTSLNYIYCYKAAFRQSVCHRWMSHFLDLTFFGCHTFWMSHSLDVTLSDCQTFWMSHFL